MTPDPWFAVTAAVVVPVTLRAWPEGLTEGPLPLPFPAGAGTAKADRATRATYFNAHTARVLYGPADTEPGEPATGGPLSAPPRRAYRWIEPGEVEPGQARVEALEVLTYGTSVTGRALAVVHLCLPTKDPLAELQALTVPRKARAGNRLLDLLDGGARAEGHLSSGLIEEIPDTVRPFTVTLAVPQGELPDGPFGSAFPWDPLHQWLFAFASGRTSGFFPADPEDTGLLDGLVRLSQDWSALALRDGVAFVGRVSSADSSYLRGSADTYVRSIYLDALLLGLIQQAELSRITEKLTDLGGSLDRLPDLLALEEEVTRFRNTYWWQHLTSHGTGNRLLVELQRQHAMPRLFEQVVRELDDYSRHAALRADRLEQQQLSRVSILLSVLTLLTVPMTLLQLMVDSRAPSSWGLRWLVVGGAAAVLLVIFSRLNRRR